MSTYEIFNKRYDELLWSSPSVFRSNIKIWLFNIFWSLLILICVATLIGTLFDEAIIEAIQKGKKESQRPITEKVVEVCVFLARIICFCGIIILFIIKKQARKIVKRNEHISQLRYLIDSMLEEMKPKDTQPQ